MKENSASYTVGVLSDTHGSLRPEVLKIFREVDMIVHAGDIGSIEVIEGLRKVAPVVAVRGNMDYQRWADSLPASELVELGEVLLYVLHDRALLDLDPAAAGISAVISGHTHRAAVEQRGGVLYVNPGTAGPFRGPTSVALLRITGKQVQAQVMRLDQEDSSVRKRGGSLK
ncbi:MAG: metallophosphoesterase family protein [Deltaproteobacteria bacterium]|nr:metallophosphoesterase family protein [Deltaproteobacteria bacterium]